LGAPHDLSLVVLSEEHPMTGRRRHRPDRRERGGDQRAEIAVALEGGDSGETGVGRHDEQEREHHLHARHEHSQLAAQFLEAAIRTLARRLVSTVKRAAPPHLVHGFHAVGIGIHRN
jgi:hypothetical protein